MSKTKSGNKPEVNKSELIRQHLKSMKPSERSPTAVSVALKKKGCEVSPGFVSVVKAEMYKKKNSKSKAKKKTSKKAWVGWDEFLGAEGKSLLLAKQFLSAAGDIQQAKKVLDVINKLMSHN